MSDVNPYSPPHGRLSANLHLSHNHRFTWRTRVVCGILLVMSLLIVISGIMKVPNSMLAVTSIAQAVVMLQLTFVTVSGRLAGQSHVG